MEDKNLEILHREFHSVQKEIEEAQQDELAVARKKREIVDTLDALTNKVSFLLTHKTPARDTEMAAIAVINALLSTITNQEVREKTLASLHVRLMRMRSEKAPMIKLEEHSVARLKRLTAILRHQGELLNWISHDIYTEKLEQIGQHEEELRRAVASEGQILKELNIDEQQIRKYIEFHNQGVQGKIQSAKERKVA